MGGFGSGNSTGRATTGGCRSIDLARLTRSSGIYSWNLDGESRGSVGYTKATHGLVLSWGLSDGSRYEKLIPWSYTRPRFGGQRRWFKCDCNRRCRVIYFASSGWRCRRCYRLAYQCQREDRGQRCQRRANKIIERLGGLLYEDCYPPKPKWMRWRTYNRLCDQADKFTAAWDLSGLDRLMRLGGMS